MEFKQECQTRRAHLTFCTIAHYLMVYSRVLEAYINVALMYITYHISLILPIKYLINEDGDTNTPFKLTTGNKLSVSHLCLLFCPCVVQKDTVRVDKKGLNIRHQAQKGFRDIFVGIHSIKKIILCTYRVQGR